MARDAHPKMPCVFRAVVVVTWDTGAANTFVYGPYTRKADASRMVTRETGRSHWGGTARGWVESAETEWHPMP